MYIVTPLKPDNGAKSNSPTWSKIKKRREKKKKKGIRTNRNRNKSKEIRETEIETETETEKEKEIAIKTKRRIKIRTIKWMGIDKIQTMEAHTLVVLWHAVKRKISCIYLVGQITETSATTIFLFLIWENANGICQTIFKPLNLENRLIWLLIWITICCYMVESIFKNWKYISIFIHTKLIQGLGERLMKVTIVAS